VALRRIIGGVLIAVLSLAAAAPALADDSVYALRPDRHVSRVAVPALAVRTTRSAQPDASPHRPSGDTPSSEEIVSSSPARGPIAASAVRSVDLLPGHWSSRHLIV
jgi:hypothetical protein